MSSPDSSAPAVAVPSSVSASSQKADHKEQELNRKNRALERRAAEKARLDELLPELLVDNAVRESERLIREGDLVIIWESNLKYVPLVIKRNAILSNRYGNFPHNSMIGLPFGSRVYSQKKSKFSNSMSPGGFVVLLKPTPELWTNALTHRTQILYLADISLICLLLNLQPGFTVVESGTGSGSLSTSLARSIAGPPNGHLHTFEFNIERVEKAKEDFKTLKIDHLISVYHRDVCGLGFPDIDGGVDAIFLDLPSPWSCLDSCARILRTGGRLCSFSPCIEQVQRACAKLAELGFTDIRTYECLDRTYEVSRQNFAKIHQRKTIGRNTGNNDRKRALDQEEGEDESEKKAKIEQDGEAEDDQQEAEAEEAEPAAMEDSAPADANPTTTASSSAPVKSDADLNRELFESLPTLPSNMLCTRSFLQMRGHTGFLTIAQYVREDNNSSSAAEPAQQPPTTTSASSAQ